MHGLLRSVFSVHCMAAAAFLHSVGASERATAFSSLSPFVVRQKTFILILPSFRGDRAPRPPPFRPLQPPARPSSNEWADAKKGKMRRSGSRSFSRNSPHSSQVWLPSFLASVRCLPRQRERGRERRTRIPSLPFLPPFLFTALRVCEVVARRQRGEERAFSLSAVPGRQSERP